MLQVALRVYPKWWRDRFEEYANEDLESLLADGRMPLALAANLAFGAVSVRLSRWSTDLRHSVVGLAVLMLTLVAFQTVHVATPSSPYGGAAAPQNSQFAVVAVCPMGAGTTLMISHRTADHFPAICPSRNNRRSS